MGISRLGPGTKTDGVPNAWKSNFLSYLIFLAQKRETFGPQVSQCGVKTDENMVMTSSMVVSPLDRAE